MGQVFSNLVDNNNNNKTMLYVKKTKLNMNYLYYSCTSNQKHSMLIRGFKGLPHWVEGTDGLPIVRENYHCALIGLPTGLHPFVCKKG